MSSPSNSLSYWSAPSYPVISSGSSSSLSVAVTVINLAVVDEVLTFLSRVSDTSMVIRPVEKG